MPHISAGVAAPPPLSTREPQYGPVYGVDSWVIGRSEVCALHTEYRVHGHVGVHVPGTSEKATATATGRGALALARSRSSFLGLEVRRGMSFF